MNDFRLSSFKGELVPSLTSAHMHHFTLISLNYIPGNKESLSLATWALRKGDMWKRQIVHQFWDSLLELRTLFLARDGARSRPLNYDAFTNTLLMTYNMLVGDRK